MTLLLEVLMKGKGSVLIAFIAVVVGIGWASVQVYIGATGILREFRQATFSVVQIKNKLKVPLTKQEKKQINDYELAHE